MKKKKLIAVAGLLSAVCLASTGCGKMTAEKLVSKLAEAEKDKQVTALSMEMDMEATYGMEMMGTNISADMNVLMNGDFKFCPDPVGAYAEMDMQVEAMEQTMDDTIETYVTEEDGMLTSYAYSETNQLWSRSAMELDYDSWVESVGGGALTASESLKDTVLEEEPAEVDGKEAYVLHASSVMDNEMFVQSLGQGLGAVMPDAKDAMSDISVEGMEIPVTFYVDKETFLPLKIEMDMNSMDEVINDILNVVMEEALEEAGQSLAMGFGSIEISLSKCDVTVSGLSYEPQEIPSVPEEAFEAIAFQEALENLEPDLGDGSYAIRSGAGVVKVVGPEDLEMAELTEDTVSFMDMNTMDTLVYSMTAAGNESLYIDSIESMYQGILEAAGYEVQTGREEGGVASAFGNLDGYWLSGGGMSIYYTFADVNGACLIVMCTEVTGGEPDAVSVLSKALEEVRELTPEDIL